MSIERHKEIRRRRHRRKKVDHFKRKLEKANPSEKNVIAAKIRRLTPGANELIGRWGLEER